MKLTIIIVIFILCLISIGLAVWVSLSQKKIAEIKEENIQKRELFSTTEERKLRKLTLYNLQTDRNIMKVTGHFLVLYGKCPDKMTIKFKVGNNKYKTIRITQTNYTLPIIEDIDEDEQTSGGCKVVYFNK